MDDFISTYWHKIDLHSHGRGGVLKNGKSDKCLYTHLEYFNRIRDNSFKLKAVTNHNTLDLADHVIYAILAKLAGASYIPGVELDLKIGSYHDFQAILLFDPARDVVQNAESINKKTEEKRSLISETNPAFYFDESDFMSFIKDSSVILVVHANKASGLCESFKTAKSHEGNFIWLYQEICRDHAFPVLFENTRKGMAHVVVKRMTEIVSSPDAQEQAAREVTTTDDHFRDDGILPARMDQVDYRINAEPSFRGLLLAVQMYKTRFKHTSDIVIPRNFIKSISFCSKQLDHFSGLHTIELSPYLNVIIGNSGSGKTLLLNSIFHAATGRDLDIQIEGNHKRKSERPYASILPKDKALVQTVWSSPSGAGVAVELNKIYSSILKATDAAGPADKFGLFPSKTAEPILVDYIGRITKYESKQVARKNAIEEGKKKLSAIINDTDFLSRNPLDDEHYSLNALSYDDTLLNSTQTLIDEIETQIKRWNSDEFMQRVAKLKSYVLPSEQDLVDELAKNYRIILLSMEKNLSRLRIKQTNLKIEKSLFGIVAQAIGDQYEKMGQKAKMLSEKAVAISESKLSVVSAVVEVLLAESEMESIDLSFPKEKIVALIDEKEKNDYARLRASYSRDSLQFQGPAIRQSSLFSGFDGRKSFSGVPQTSMEDSDSVKNLCEYFTNIENMSLSSFISKEIPYFTEIRVDQTWKNYSEINPGSVVKSYMNYFFTKLIKEESPDVIFIDQPENDVDKTFITETLSRFVLKQKPITQFIITTHEPIIAVNSDANCIIESRIGMDNKFSYDGYSLEGFTSIEPKFGTDAVATVLDGGKDNVFMRNEIYGGRTNG